MLYQSLGCCLIGSTAHARALELLNRFDHHWKRGPLSADRILAIHPEGRLVAREEAIVLPAPLPERVPIPIRTRSETPETQPD